MKIIRTCPCCNSTRIRGSILLQNGNYSQFIICEKCGYKNVKEIGSAERIAMIPRKK